MGLSDMLGEVYDDEPEEEEGEVNAAPADPPAAEVATPPPVAPEPEPVVAESIPEPVVVAPEPEPVVAESIPEPVVVAPEPEPVVAESIPEPVVVAPAPALEPEPFIIESKVVVEEDAFPIRATPSPEWASEDALDAAFADWQPEESVALVAEEPVAMLIVDPEPEPVKTKRRGLFGRGKKQEQTEPDEGDVHFLGEPMEVIEVADVTDVREVEVIESLVGEDVVVSELMDLTIDELEAVATPEAPDQKKERRGLFGRSKKKGKAESVNELVLSDFAEVSFDGTIETDILIVAAAPRGPILNDDLLPNRKGRK